ncbi:hypothetical protein KKG90_11120 [Candidatus Bipolaricaulota bacterium]|nr:hypothetical protein [Candidatus Bipolaricaulota bacterium]
MDHKIVIKNVNILDLRKTTKETFDTIGFIKNANLILVSPETADYMPGIHAKNINTVAEIPPNVEIQTCMSHVTIDANYLSGFPSPRFLLVMGKVIVEPDVTQELLNTKLAGLVAMGRVICPEALAGTIQSKAKLMMGGTITYPSGSVLVANSLTLDDDYLNTLDDGTHLVATGSLRIIDHVSTELIEKKIHVLHAYGNILCRQEHALAIKAKLAKTKGMTVIPAGHRLIEGSLPLDTLTLQTLENEKMFCMGDVIIDANVDSQALDAAISKLGTLGAILCPVALKDVLKAKCDMLDNRVVLYEGTLWYVDDARQLLADQFDYIDGLMTLVIRDELTIGPDVSPETILKRIHKIHNLGDIVCQPEQQAAIEARLGIREGDISTPCEPETEKMDEGPYIGNANVLVL